ncbi:hypothetical protein HaLaN_29252 [Haematococcus lacustris]|uniref:Uncharacterized protein n=1 Tax=Haematococcus lacustris TaxID=44745 RepID=A0A6A0ADP7_HAELA|nr:hypothetical protein HaLaN_29252 [Haematococcus lacustris]
MELDACSRAETLIISHVEYLATGVSTASPALCIGRPGAQASGEAGWCLWMSTAPAGSAQQ